MRTSVSARRLGQAAGLVKPNSAASNETPAAASKIVATGPPAVQGGAMSGSTRADKWLWATRFFKTRGLAAEICTDGKVRRNGHVLKPASPVQAGDVLEIPFPEGPGIRTVRVAAAAEKRLGPPAARACYEDLTPPEVYSAVREWFAAKRLEPKGRPTKRNRREIDRIHGFWDDL